jgi:DNA repair protein RadC
MTGASARGGLHDRVTRYGADAATDAELLSVLIGLPVDRCGDLIGRCGGTVAALVAGDGAAIVAEISAVTLARLRACRAIAVALARQQIAPNRPALSSWQAVIEYCRAAMAYEPVEQFRVLFLDRKNRLIADEAQQRGTVDHTPVYPREVVKRALELAASAIILVHNHPSGDPTPSQGDIAMTKEVTKAADALGIALHDHLIISRSAHASLKALGLI